MRNIDYTIIGIQKGNAIMKQSELLKSIDGLTRYQKSQLEKHIIDMLKINSDLKQTKPAICPMCNTKSHIVKRELTKLKKKRYWCKDCRSVFAYDIKTITMYMKIGYDQSFQIVRLGILNFVTIRDTATQLD